MTKTVWLKCDVVTNGMFSDEVTVVVSKSNGTQESFFVPAKDVRQKEHLIRVEAKNAGSFYWATLPTSEGTTIPVDSTRIEIK